MAVETLQYVYTSEDEMERILSNLGVALRISDLTGQNRTQYLVELCEEATDVVNLYLSVFYDEANMVNNSWIRSCATWIGLTLLCRRKANQVPQGILDRYEEYIDYLEKVRAGQLLIPRLPTRSDMTPAMSNLRVDDRYYTRKLRVNPSISVGGSSGSQDLDWWWSYDWF